MKGDETKVVVVFLRLHIIITTIWRRWQHSIGACRSEMLYYLVFSRSLHFFGYIYGKWEKKKTWPPIDGESKFVRKKTLKCIRVFWLKKKKKRKNSIKKKSLHINCYIAGCGKKLRTEHQNSVARWKIGKYGDIHQFPKKQHTKI